MNISFGSEFFQQRSASAGGLYVLLRKDKKTSSSVTLKLGKPTTTMNLALVWVCIIVLLQKNMDLCHGWTKYYTQL